MVRKYLTNALKRAFLRVHEWCARAGLTVLPVHYYSPVPNILELRRTREVWARRSEMRGVRVDLDRQVENLQRICLPFRAEYLGNGVYLRGLAEGFGPGYGYLEAQALHAVIRYHKPKRIVEVGGGVSTYCMRHALQRNEEETGRRAAFACIEPFPSSRLRNVADVKLFISDVRLVPMSMFDALEENDLLFIDSSHAVRPGSDVVYLVLEVLPRLRTGVVVHFHDVYFPFDYPRDSVRTFFHAMESALLHAFLVGNRGVEIIFCLSQLHYDRGDVLAEIFPEYAPQGGADGLMEARWRPFENPSRHFPSSIFLRRLAE